MEFWLHACIDHREEFLISTHQDPSSGDSSSHRRPLNQRGGGGQAQVRGSTRNGTDKSELRGGYICSPLTGARLHVDDFMMDEGLRRPAEHGDGSWRSGTGHRPRLKKRTRELTFLFPPQRFRFLTLIQRCPPPPQQRHACAGQNEKETRKGRGQYIWSPSTAWDMAPHLVKVMYSIANSLALKLLPLVQEMFLI